MIDARAIARRVEGVVHPEAELVELVWTPLDEARRLDLPNITRLALDDLAEALKGGLDRRRLRPFYRELRGKRSRRIIGAYAAARAGASRPASSIRAR